MYVYDVNVQLLKGFDLRFAAFFVVCCLDSVCCLRYSTVLYTATVIRYAFPLFAP